MKKTFNVAAWMVLGVLALAACSTSYNISGTSLQSFYDGDMVYLRPLGGEDTKAVDSCKILHGAFTMSGPVDSVMCVRMFFGTSGDNIPIILEEGNIRVIDLNNAMKVEGTPLNDKFYAFMTERDSLMFLLQELPRKESAMILDGYDHDEILRQLGEEEGNLRMAIDKLETDFITANYDNVLGLTYFLVLCDNAYNQFGFPTTTPQIDEIYGRAPESFRENKDVKDYMSLCEGNGE
ncbi:MAG: DUF4369 domain-containing protein [Bacteroidaceae bacterium]|nr:DUF4369 domain-containing protein [Bacteroidaceae bacterium]